jgi:hypothetical protein
MRGVGYAGGGGTFLAVWIFRREWDIARGVVYARGGGTLPEVWNMQKEVGHCGRCGIGKRGEHCERCGFAL